MAKQLGPIFIYIYILFLYLCLLLGIYICDLFDVILRLNRGGQTICVFCCFFGEGFINCITNYALICCVVCPFWIYFTLLSTVGK